MREQISPLRRFGTPDRMQLRFQTNTSHYYHKGMTSWHDEIVTGVQQQFKAAAEATERERKRRAAALDFWQSSIEAVRTFCSDANRQLGKETFIAVSVGQDDNYWCSITYKGPNDWTGHISLDGDQRVITFTLSGSDERFTLQPGGASGAVAVHANGRQFTCEELAEEVIRSIVQIDAGRKFQMPARSIIFDEDVESREC